MTKYPPSKKQKEIIEDIEKATGERFTGQYSDEAYAFIAKAFEEYNQLMSIRAGTLRLANFGLREIDEDMEQHEGTNPMGYKN